MALLLCLNRCIEVSYICTSLLLQCISSSHVFSGDMLANGLEHFIKAALI